MVRLRPSDTMSGPELQSARQRAGMTQAQLAAAVGCSDCTSVNWSSAGVSWVRDSAPASDGCCREAKAHSIHHRLGEVPTIEAVRASVAEAMQDISNESLLASVLAWYQVCML